MHLKSIPSAVPSTKANGFRPAYNLFRREHHLDLYCAVPEDYPVPAFVAGDGWTFAGTLDGTAAAPRGFERDAAKAVVPLTGFYLFTMFQPARENRTVPLMRWAA